MSSPSPIKTSAPVAPMAFADATLARLSSTAIAMSKRFLPDAGQEAGLMARLGARTVVGATVRAVQLLGRQFVLGQTIGEALDTAAGQRRRQAGLRFSYDMLWEGARTDADALRYGQAYADALALALEARELRAAPQVSAAACLRPSSFKCTPGVQPASRPCTQSFVPWRISSSRVMPSVAGSSETCSTLWFWRPSLRRKK